MEEPTADPTVVIESRGDGWVRYRNLEGRRWEVHGVCDQRGDCLIGAVVDGRELTSRAVSALSSRAVSSLDVPVTPEFRICCGSDIFTYVELERSPG